VALQRQIHANLGTLDCASFAEATFDTHDKSLAPHLHPLHSLNATARRRRSTLNWSASYLLGFAL
jgi:hypothetical protein